MTKDNVKEKVEAKATAYFKFCNVCQRKAQMIAINEGVMSLKLKSETDIRKHQEVLARVGAKIKKSLCNRCKQMYEEQQ